MICRRRFLALSACALAAGPARAATPQIWRGTAMGADVALRVEGAEPRTTRAFFAEAARVLRAMDTTFSLHRGSELGRLNALGRLRHPPADMVALLRLAGRVHDATGGAFDPSVQPLWQAHRTGGDNASAATMLGWPEVTVTEAEIRLPRPGMALTLNGIAQGFAADRLADVARRHDLGDVLIDAGETRAMGPRHWHAAIVASDGRRIRDLVLQDRALATSAPFGTRIGPAADRPHILDPRGKAPRWSLASVSASEAALADALSTAFCVMDRAAIADALAAFPDARLEALQSA